MSLEKHALADSPAEYVVAHIPAKHASAHILAKHTLADLTITLVAEKQMNLFFSHKIHLFFSHKCVVLDSTRVFHVFSHVFDIPLLVFSCFTPVPSSSSYFQKYQMPSYRKFT